MIFTGSENTQMGLPTLLTCLFFHGHPCVGYVFESASAILPFLERPRTGVTSEFCASTARRLRCYVAAGYPEILEPHEVERRTLEGQEGGGVRVVDVVGANSAVVYGPDGTCVGNVRKSHLFHMDKPWAKAGSVAPFFILLDRQSPLPDLRQPFSPTPLLTIQAPDS
jgi:protein N-terminal amidase